MCTSTCDRALDLGATYRMTGPGVRTSKSFQLDGTPGADVELEFERKSSSAFATGIALTATGSFFLSIGLVFDIGTLVALASVTSAGDGAGSALGGAALGGAIGGGATLIGLALLFPGVLLVANNGGSKVKHVDTQEQSVPQPQPIFRDAQRDPPMPRVMSIPIFTGTF